eukprot:CAMPEP_0168438698 /NCGR_PEP_ID=MMETSP0228-20121227/42094_1 /TAXON_ID=133427 /ORGANISM="Protoceratium reticulatum, Strain CCCM 535 (=CCMP 1889)" /LENGTH=134 /DNA_ID=CAMNT_0008452971 /DNA_START=27 /DNA_END=431 /DNA_ORIENTATION=+
MSSVLHGYPTDKVFTITVQVDDKDETVTVHPEKGPLVRMPDGSTSDMQFFPNLQHNSFGGGAWPRERKQWHLMKPTEKEILLHMVAKKNLRLREWQESGKAQPELPAFMVGIVAELQRRNVESLEALAWQGQSW